MKWSIVNTQEDKNIVWVCKFPLNSMLAARFATMVGAFVTLLSRGVLGKGNTIEVGSMDEHNTTPEDDNDMCPECGNLLCVTSITAYDNRVECKRCGYFMVKDVVL